MDRPDTTKANEDSPEDPPEKPTTGQWLWSEFKFFSKLGVFILAFLTFVWGHFKIPSESMQPTLEVGDHLYVSKYAYGFSKHSLPYLLHKLPLPEGRVLSKLPKRGDVVVFRNPHTGLVMIKRVVGLPGDRIQVRRGQLFLNDEQVERERLSERLYREHRSQSLSPQRVDVYRQQLPGMKSSFTIYERNDVQILDNTPVFIVPEDSLFFMGDNRDNSIDSRDTRRNKETGLPIGPGIIHMNYVIGRADRMMFSFKKCNRNEGLYCPPKGRWMEKL